MSKHVVETNGTTSEHEQYVGPKAEITVDTDKKTAVIQDGVTPGGVPLAREDMSNVGSLPPGVAAQLKGDIGPQGVKGDKGDKGDNGAQGVQGVKGDNGAQGPQGVKGVKGDTGATGAKGATGAQGPVGATFTLSGSTLTINT